VDGKLALNGSSLASTGERWSRPLATCWHCPPRSRSRRQSCATNIGTRGVGFRLAPNLIPDPIQEQVVLLAEHGPSG
jgi:hypothetical protein